MKLWPFSRRRTERAAFGFDRRIGSRVQVSDEALAAGANPDASADSVPAATAAVSLLSTLLAGLPPTVVSRDGAPRPNHPVSTMLAHSTSTWSPRALWEFLFRQMLAHGWAAAHIVRGARNEPVELLPAYTLASSARWGTDIGQYDLGLCNGRIISRLPRSEVLIIAGDGYDGLCAPSPITRHASTINVLGNAAQHMAATLKNGVHIGGVVESETEVGAAFGWELPRTAELRKKIADVFGGLARAGQVPVLPPGFSWKSVPFSAVDIQLIELLQLGIEDICRIYRLPPRLLYQYRRGTRLGAEVGESNTEIVQYSIAPRAQSIGAQLTAQLLPSATDGTSIVLDPESLAAGSIASRVATIDQAVARAGVMTINEARAYLNTGRLPRLAPVTDGDRLLDPKGAPTQPRGEPMPDDPADDDDMGGGDNDEAEE